MSWIFGIIGAHNFNLESYLKNHNLLYAFRSEKLSVFAGGLKENIFYEKLNDSSGWLVCGIGIERNREKYCFADFSSWKSYVSKLQEDNNFGQLNGHYAGIKWKEGEVFFFNDILGIRDLFFLKEKSFTAFSTRPDFFLTLGHKFEPDLKELSGYWLLAFPLTTNSIFKYIERLGPGGKYIFSGNKCEKKTDGLNFEFKDELPVEEYIENLKLMTNFPLTLGKKISLGLTGGMDSRVLLEMLLETDSNNWQTHFFGPQDLPDVVTAKRISIDKKIQYQYLQEQISKPDESLKLLKEYIAQLGPTGMASAILFYPFYTSLHDQKIIIIDGGHGELHRRESLNRILFLAENALLKKVSTELYRKFARKRADIFNNHVLNFLENEALGHISNLLDKMPDPKIIGSGNWIDILMIKYSLPNLTGPSQTLLDSIAVAYMPYIQFDLLRDSFRIPPGEKRNGKIFKDILKASGHNLNRYSLVKNSIYYPYSANSFLKRLITLSKRKLGSYYKETAGEQFLHTMKDYIFDTMNSAEFNAFNHYDHSKIKQMVHSFYNGNKSMAAQVNWWLTFDIWRSVFFNK